jgi:NADH dehydrogenase [ubiquinone] 1 alpha subcomplex assembly factor 2
LLVRHCPCLSPSPTPDPHAHSQVFQCLPSSHAGLDLHGNTYWEFHDAITTGRMRRIVEYPSNVQYSDVKLTPQWHQWLRHTRQHPPSLTEQSQDLVRQEQLKVLAQRADERWNSKESYLDAPREQKRLPATQIKDAGGYTGDVDDSGKGVQNLVSGQDDFMDAEQQTPTSQSHDQPSRAPTPRDSTSRVREQPKQRDDPWKRARGGPSEEWQPQAWSGENAQPRR